MNFLQQAQQLAQGDMLQAKWMIGLAVVILLPAALLLFKSGFSLQKGLAIPVCLLLAVNLAYGGYVILNKPKALLQTEQAYAADKVKALHDEKERAAGDNASYRTMKMVWGFCAALFIIIYFLAPTDFYRGITLGSAGLFLAFLIIDSFFHQRLGLYILGLDKL